jgi:iron complex outermembrane receptor protein
MSTGFRSYGYPRAVLMGSASLMALVAYSAANAQQAAPAASQPGAAQNSSDQLTEVIVTGYRASLQNALDEKRKSDLPIESVAAEDLGKLPDQNVAEALQRLPGIQIDRAGGQGTAVLIDGLRQNLTTLNGDVFLTGKEFYVSGEASGGGAGSNSQYASLEGIPSEEIGGIDVYKNPKASITEGGLGGTIDLKSRDPLAQPDGLSLGGNFRETFGQRSSGWTPVATLVGAYKFSDVLAFTASVSYDDEKTHDLQFQDQNRAAWLITNSATGPYVGPLSPAGISKLPGNKFYIIPQLGYFTDDYDRRKTTGAAFGVSAKITDSIKSTFNYFYSREQDTSDSYSDKAWFNGQGAAAGTPAAPGTALPSLDPTKPYSIDGNEVVQNGTFNANGAETATLYQQNTSVAHNFQWRTSFDDGGPLRGALDFSYANATSDLQAAQADVEHGLYNAFSGVATSPTAPGCNNGASTCTVGNHGYEFVWNNGGTSGLPGISYSPNPGVLNNPAFTTFKSNWAWANLTSEHDFAIKGDISYAPDFIQGIDSLLSGGFRYAGRDVNQVFGRYLITGPTGTGLAGAPVANCCQDPNGGNWLYYQDPGYAAIPYSTAVSNPGLAMTVNNFGAGNIIVKNPVTGGMTNPSTYLEKVWAGAGVPNGTERFFRDGLSSFSVEERTTSVYLMGDLGGPANHFHMNYGVRVVDTQLTIDNGQSSLNPHYFGTAVWNGVDSDVIALTTKRNYVDVLPSFNFVLDVTDNQKIRFGAARVVSPQDLFKLGVGNSYNFTRYTGTTRVNIHNGTNDGFFFINGNSGNAQLDPYRATQFNLSYEDYFARDGLVSVAGFYKQVDNFVETVQVPTVVQDDFGGTSGPVQTFANAGKGKIYGFELGGQYAFGYNAMAWMKGFGIAANYTYSKSDSDQPTSFTTTGPIPGVAKNSFTGTLYYERGGFSARASYSWRDKVLNDSLVGSSFSFQNQVGVVTTYPVYGAPYGQLDAQIGYDINSHFGILAQFQNLTDQALHTYLMWPNEPFTYEDAGRRYFLGFKFKL